MICWILASLALAGGFIYRRVMWPPVLECGSGKTLIACVGDSITYSLGVLGRRKRLSYPALLARLLGPDCRTRNYGLSDRTLLSTADKPYFGEKRGRAAWDVQADTVIFMLGSNDCKRKNWNREQFESEYRQALRHYQSSARQVVAMVPPRLFVKKPGKTGYDNAILRDELAPIVKKVAAECGVACVDLYALTENHPEWFPDDLHPNRDGNRAIAEAVAKVIEL